MKKIGLIIGRFQPFHNGHKLLVETALQENDHCIILVGSSNKQNIWNPYSFEVRKHMIELELGKSKEISIMALNDFEDDLAWKDEVIKHLPLDTQQATLYCGDQKADSAVITLQQFEDSIPFQLCVREIPRSIIPISATVIRGWIQNSDHNNLQKYLGENSLKYILKISEK